MTDQPAQKTPVSHRDQIGVTDLFLVALGLGLTAGLVHVVVILVRQHLLGHVMFAGRDIMWMAQIGYALVLLTGALPLMIVVGLARRPIVGQLALFLVVLAGTYAMLLHATAIHTAALLVLALGLAARMHGVVSREPRIWRQRLVRASTLASALGILVGGGSLVARQLQERQAVATLPPVASGRPNVLLLILDTVRAASMSLYGYERSTTPNLERLAHEAATFDWAIAPAPWTLPSHATLFTGRWPMELSARWRVPLDDVEPTLAEVMREAGYATGGFSANVWYASSESGIARGFVRFQAYRRTVEQVIWSTTLAQVPAVRDLIQSRRLSRAMLRPERWRWMPNAQTFDRKWAPMVTDEFLDWQAGLDGRPFLAFLNYFDAHDPYWPPDPWRTRFAADPTDQDAYDGSIAMIDDDLARLFASLRARGILDNTIVIITSDHGELFGEHELTSHGNSLYLPLLHVPLVIRFPAQVAADARIREPVSLRDLGATILDLADIEHADWPGRSFAGLLAPGAEPKPIPFPIVAEVEGSPEAGPENDHDEPTAYGDMRAVFLDRWHYILRGDGNEEVYNFLADPEEAHNLVDSLAGSPLLTQLRTWAREYP